MNRLSVIIPYHSTPTELESSLLSLLENRPENCEICVVLNQSYENIYELSEEEVQFLNVVEQIKAENQFVSDCMRFGLAACDSTYVYMMPAGVEFHSEWLAALEIMDQSEDLGAFFLDANLTLGGFFRKPLLESFLQNSEDSGLSAVTDAECLMNLVSLMQEANLPCGLAKIEVVDDDLKTESAIELESTPQAQSAIEPESTPQAQSAIEPESTPQAQSAIEPESTPRAQSAIEPESTPRAQSAIEPESTPQAQSAIEPEFTPQAQLESDSAVDSQVETGKNSEIEPDVKMKSVRESEEETESRPETEMKLKPIPSTDYPAEVSLLARFCAKFRGFFK